MSYNITTRQGRLNFLTETWETTAYWAYQAYLTHGRGAVVIPVLPDGSGDLKWLTSAPKNSELELARCLREYDPDKEIVVIFKFPDGRGAFGRYGIDDYPPPQVWASVVKKYDKEAQE